LEEAPADAATMADVSPARLRCASRDGVGVGGSPAFSRMDQAPAAGGDSVKIAEIVSGDWGGMTVS